MSGREKRKSVRTKLRARVRLAHPDLGQIDLHTGDISDTGAYILAEGQPVPQIGEVVEVQVQGMGDGEAPVVSMRVVRIDKEGIGLVFLADDESTS